MTTTKTSSQIAETFAARFETLEASYDNIRNTIAEAIEAERSPLLIDPDEAQELADRFREAAEGDSGDSEISAACDMAEYLESLAAQLRRSDA